MKTSFKDREIHSLLEAIGKKWGEKQESVLKDNEDRGSRFQNANYNERWETLPPSWLAFGRIFLKSFCKKMKYPLPQHSITMEIQGIVLFILLFLRELASGIWQRWRQLIEEYAG